MKRNGKIELMRFICCMVVILFHCTSRFGIKPLFEIFGLPVTFFKNGFISVEFFFIVSGFLMTKSIYKSVKNNIQGDLGKDTVKFVWKKYTTIFPQHIVAFIALAIINVVDLGLYKDGYKFFEFVAKVIPNLLLIQKWGFDYKNINGLEWYISAMLLAMYIIYPLCKKFYNSFVHICAPLTAILIYGYIAKNYGTFRGAAVWTGDIYVCVLRAIAGICVGVIVFEVARVLSEKELTKKQRMSLTVLEILGYLLILGYMLTSTNNRCEVYAVIVLGALITLIFSDKTYGNERFNNKFFYFLGNVSLPLYLCQNIGFYFADLFFEDSRMAIRVTMVVIFSFIATALCKFFADLLVKGKNLFLQKISN